MVTIAVGAIISQLHQCTNRSNIVALILAEVQKVLVLYSLLLYHLHIHPLSFIKVNALIPLHFLKRKTTQLMRFNPTQKVLQYY